MRQQIIRLSVHQTSKVLAVMYLLMGLLFMPFFLLATFAAPDGEGFGIGFAILIPLVYGVLGYVFVALGCALYNVVARHVGGIEFVLQTDGGSATP